MSPAMIPELLTCHQADVQFLCWTCLLFFIFVPWMCVEICWQHGSGWFPGLLSKNDLWVPPCRVCDFAPAFFHEISNLTWNPCTLSMRSTDVCLVSQSALWPASTSEHLWYIICSWSQPCWGACYSTSLGCSPCGAIYKLPWQILELRIVLNGKIGAEYIKDSQKELMRPDPMKGLALA